MTIMDRATFSQSQPRLASVSTILRPGEEVVEEVEELPRHRPCLTYEEAGQVLGGISADSVRNLVEAGVLDRPEWSRSEVRAAVVTTVSVYRAADWPVRPLEPV